MSPLLGRPAGRRRGSSERSVGVGYPHQLAVEDLLNGQCSGRRSPVHNDPIRGLSGTFGRDAVLRTVRVRLGIGLPFDSEQAHTAWAVSGRARSRGLHLRGPGCRRCDGDGRQMLAVAPGADSRDDPVRAQHGPAGAHPLRDFVKLGTTTHHPRPQAQRRHHLVRGDERAHRLGDRAACPKAVSQ